MDTDGPLTEQPLDPEPRLVTVAWERLPGWIERYDVRHPDTTWTVSPRLVTANSGDGTRVAFGVPLGDLTDLSLAGLRSHLQHPWRIGIVLVRRGGFAVARLVGERVVESKVGQRHVQGRSKAGGWSQQRFARRRDNQAVAAFDAAASHVGRLLVPHATSLDLLATGGDRQAVRTVLTLPAVSALSELPQLWVGAFPDPRRDVLTAAIAAAGSVRIEIWDPPTESLRPKWTGPASTDPAST